MARTRVFLPVAVALVFALAGAVIAYKWAQSQRPDARQRTADASADVVNVAVAAAQIPWGAKLSTENIQMKAFLSKSLPATGYFTDPAGLSGRVAIAPLETGDIIVESRLAPVGATGGIAAVVTPGNRAIAVKGDKVVGLAGLIRPRDRVDVLVTIEARDGGEKAGQVTKIVLENILVLAAGPQMQKADKGESPVDVYTLEVTPDDGEKLALASNEGKLHFALRNTTDSEIVLTRGATVLETLDSYRAQSAGPDAQPLEVTAGTGYYSVEVIRGTSRANVDF